LTRSTAGPPPDTLPAERTVLAWTRTSFAFLANGALLTIKDIHGARGLAALILAGLAGAAALCTYVIAVQRQRTLQRRPIPTRITPRRQVYVVGIAALLLIVLTMVAQL
jgi:uncharacterized membrane protein YidH (DUF202 family)